MNEVFRRYVQVTHKVNDKWEQNFGLWYSSLSTMLLQASNKVSEYLCESLAMEHNFVS